MNYIVYQITNKIDGKVYIGMHQTNDINDGYMGSGKYLKRAINKYGLENFTKEILHVFDNEQDMIDKEIELVTEEFCSRKDTYNICPGGKGGFGYLNTSSKEHLERCSKAGKIGIVKANLNSFEKRSKSSKTKWKCDNYRTKMIHFLNEIRPKTHSEDVKRKIGEANSKFTGSKNSQYGTMWITNGIENRKIKKVDDIPEGWYKGRKTKI